jgi:outer membrane protein OmpA-like peptidoglycan-associated protein
MAREIADKGRVALYGIHFDTDRADVKPESKPALEQIARLLGRDARIRLYVVGHTDGAGGFDHNLDLSRRRAQAVVQALAQQYAVDAARLRPLGVGPAAPVASNRNDGGRAKNRRVELVEQ